MQGDHRNRTAQRHFVVACKLPSGYEPAIGTEYEEAAADRRAKVAKLLQGIEAGDEKDVRLALSRTEPLISGRCRDAGLDVLSKIGYGRDWVITEVLERLHKSQGADQAVALQALSAATPRGHKDASQAVKSRLLDPSPFVRRAALKAWGSLAVHGDAASAESACLAILPLLEDSEVIVRRSAVAAFEELANRPRKWCWGDTSIIAALSARLEDSDFEVRRSTVRALAFAASKGDPQAICQATRLLEHEDPRIRNTAIEVLPALASPEDPLLTAGIVRRLGRSSLSTGRASDAEIRETATRTLKSLSGAASPRAVAEITKLMTADDDVAVRCAATRALASTAKRGDPMAVSAAYAACADASLDVRREGGFARKALEVRPWVPIRIRRKQEAKDAEFLRCQPTTGATVSQAPPVAEVDAAMQATATTVDTK